eukprot:1181983-Prorocentrum_minimum.AAC.2
MNKDLSYNEGGSGLGSSREMPGLGRPSSKRLALVGEPPRGTKLALNSVTKGSFGATTPEAYLWIVFLCLKLTGPMSSRCGPVMLCGRNVARFVVSKWLTALYLPSVKIWGRCPSLRPSAHFTGILLAR